MDKIFDLDEAKAILDHGLFPLISASFISADTIVDAETAVKSLECISMLKETFSKLYNSDDPNDKEYKDKAKECIEFCEKGISIAKRDLEEYSKKEGINKED